MTGGRKSVFASLVIGGDRKRAEHYGKFALTICNKYGKGSHKMKKTEEEK